MRSLSSIDSRPGRPEMITELHASDNFATAEAGLLRLRLVEKLCWPADGLGRSVFPAPAFDSLESESVPFLLCDEDLVGRSRTELELAEHAERGRRQEHRRVSESSNHLPSSPQPTIRCQGQARFVRLGFATSRLLTSRPHSLRAAWHWGRNDSHKGSTATGLHRSPKRPGGRQEQPFSTRTFRRRDLFIPDRRPLRAGLPRSREQLALRVVGDGAGRPGAIDVTAPGASALEGTEIVRGSAVGHLWLRTAFPPSRAPSWVGGRPRATSRTRIPSQQRPSAAASFLPEAMPSERCLLRRKPRMLQGRDSPVAVQFSLSPCRTTERRTALPTRFIRSPAAVGYLPGCDDGQLHPALQSVLRRATPALGIQALAAPTRPTRRTIFDAEVTSAELTQTRVSFARANRLAPALRVADVRTITRLRPPPDVARPMLRGNQGSSRPERGG